MTNQKNKKRILKPPKSRKPRAPRAPRKPRKPRKPRPRRFRQISDGSHRLHTTFVRNHFERLLIVNKYKISWVGPTYNEVNVLCDWFLNIRSQYRSLRIVRLAFIHDYGKQQKQILEHGLKQKNPGWDSFKRLKLTNQELNKFRAWNRQVLGLIHSMAIRCYFTGQQIEGTQLTRFYRQSLKKDEVEQKKKLTPQIKRLEMFWDQLRRRQVVIEENQPESKEQSDQDFPEYFDPQYDNHQNNLMRSSVLSSDNQVSTRKKNNSEKQKKLASKTQIKKKTQRSSSLTHLKSIFSESEIKSSNPQSQSPKKNQSATVPPNIIPLDDEENVAHSDESQPSSIESRMLRYLEDIQQSYQHERIRKRDRENMFDQN